MHAFLSRPMRFDSDPRRLEAAKQVGSKRAALEQEVIDEEMPVARAIEEADKDKALKKIRAVELIQCYKSYGEVKARRLMAQLNIAPSRRIGGLGQPQRRNLARAIDED